MTTTDERVSRLEAESEEIRTHFATKADLYELESRLTRLLLYTLAAQTGFLVTAIGIAVGVILRFG